MSIAGLEVYNSDGTLRNGVTDKLSRIVGTANVSGRNGVMAWPYPAVVGKRAVYAVSNLAPQNNVFSNAYAMLSADGNTITYGVEGDRSPMTLIFMVY